MKKEYRIAVAGTGYVGLSIVAPTNVYLKLSVAIWWSTVAYKTHAKYPYCEPVLLQSKVVTWYLHFSEELEVVRGDDCSCCNKEALCSCTVLTKWVCVRVMTIKVSTLKNGEARQRVMTLRLNTLLVSCYANGEFFRDGFIELFPRGNCGIVCDWLGRYFLEYANVRSWYTSGETESEW